MMQPSADEHARASCMRVVAWLAGAVVIMAVAIQLAVVDRRSGRTQDRISGMQTDLRTFVTQGGLSAWHVPGALVNRQEPDTCDLAISAATVNVVVSSDLVAPAGRPDACTGTGEVGHSLFNLAADCTVWLPVLSLSPSTRTCVRFSETQLSVCVWMDRRRMYLRRCIGGACEVPPVSCGLPLIRHLPLCWQRGIAVPWANICRAPLVHPRLLLQAGGERRIMLSSKTPSGRLLFGSEGLYSLSYGDVVHDPYEHRRYSVEVRVMDPPVDDAVLDGVQQDGGDTRFDSWIQHYGLVLHNIGNNPYILAATTLVGSPFVCTPTGVRFGTDVRVVLTTDGTWDVSHGSVLVWDRVAQRLSGAAHLDALDGNTDAVTCVFAASEGEPPLVYP